MSFKEYRATIQNGDTVVLFMGNSYMLPLKLVKGEVYQTKFGALHHDDVIGKEYGSKILTGRGFLYVLHFTPELWTLNLPHRTQVLYATDISMVTVQLDLKPGSVVVESGTGSGSLSHSIIRTIAPTGHLYTYEFHEERAAKARQEFKAHDIGEYVTVHHRDVCENGFDLEHVADAVFLDLPKPWLALKSAKTAIKQQGGRLCSFSPCIEQVQRTSEMLRQLGFIDVKTVECLLRTFDVRSVSMPLPQLAPVVKKRPFMEDKDVMHEICDKVKKSKPIDDNDQKEEAEVKGESDSKDMENNVEEDSKDIVPKKRGGVSRDKTNPIAGSVHVGEVDAKYKTGIPPSIMPGHTGYLTFATLLHSG